MLILFQRRIFLIGQFPIRTEPKKEISSASTSNRFRSLNQRSDLRRRSQRNSPVARRVSIQGRGGQDHLYRQGQEPAQSRPLVFSSPPRRPHQLRNKNRRTRQ